VERKQERKLRDDKCNLSIAPVATVLVVDDARCSRRALRLVLEAEGFRVLAAHGAEAALATARAQVPDIFFGLGNPSLRRVRSRIAPCTSRLRTSPVASLREIASQAYAGKAANHSVEVCSQPQVLFACGPAPLLHP
jgi:CheY-like chemotaxis protein